MSHNPEDIHSLCCPITVRGLALYLPHFPYKDQEHPPQSFSQEWNAEEKGGVFAVIKPTNEKLRSLALLMS